MNGDVRLWSIHAGETGNSDRLFKKKDVAALGWCGTLHLATRRWGPPS